MPIYPPVTPPTGTADNFFTRKQIPACPLKRDVTDWHMWTTLSGINASNYSSYFDYTDTSEIAVARRQKIDESVSHMMNLYHNLRQVKLFVDFSADGAAEAWYYSGTAVGGIPFSGTITSEDVYGEEGPTDPLTEDDVVTFLEDTNGGFLQDNEGNYENPETGVPYYIDTWIIRYPITGTISFFSDERPPKTRVPCPVGNASINPGQFYEPLVNYFPFFEALYYDDVYMGVAVRYISSWDSGWLMTDCGRFTGTQGTVILGGSIQSDSTSDTPSNMERDLAYVDFPTQSTSANAPKMLCEATALGYESRSANAAGLTASGTTVTGSGVTNEATNTIYNTGYGINPSVWFWQYE